MVFFLCVKWTMGKRIYEEAVTGWCELLKLSKRIIQRAFWPAIKLCPAFGFCLCCCWLLACCNLFLSSQCLPAVPIWHPVSTHAIITTHCRAVNHQLIGDGPTVRLEYVVDHQRLQLQLHFPRWNLTDPLHLLPVCGKELQ